MIKRIIIVLVVMAAIIFAPFFVIKITHIVDLPNKGIEWILGVSIIAAIFCSIITTMAIIGFVYNYIKHG